MKKLLLVSMLLLGAAQGFAQIAVIANKNVDLAISKVGDVVDIFTLEVQKSKNGVQLVLFDQKGGSVQEQFYAAVGKSAMELKKIWMKAQLSGNGKAPEAMDGEDAVLAKVASTPGAVGYVSEAKAKGDVKVIFVIK
jgi:ABC-type phosphate transport system substrate-binding protein